MTLLLSLALATEPAPVSAPAQPSRPVLDEAATDACPAMDLHAKVPYTSPCDAVALSLAQASWFGEMAVYADEMRDLRHLDTVSLREQLKYADQRADFYKTVAETPKDPKMPAAAWFGIGVGSGIVAILGGAVAVRWASETPVTSVAQ